MGLKGATSHYACAWCKLHEDDHWNMEFELNYYQSAELKRILKEMIELLQKKNAKEKYCCEHKLLMNIRLDNTVLIENLIKDALQWNQKDNLYNKRGEQKNKHLNDLQKTTRSCGISFEI